MPELGLREVISTRHAPDPRAGRRGGGKAMLAEVSAVVRAPNETVSAVFASYQNWPGLFPTISGVRLVSRDGPRLALEVDHVEGTVANELILRCPDDIDLWEVKRRYDACFRNRFVAVPEGTLFTVTGEVWPTGWARLLRPFLPGYMRRRMRRFQLRPVQAEAEAQARRARHGDDQR
ncbi:MAG TPA: SRPBCC family protein [Streptosporangiaceae bacterium]|nr:SRPBCC family protein [Streptosporangiaceae bacterium]